MFYIAKRTIAVDDEASSVAARFGTDQISALRTTLLGGPTASFIRLSSAASHTRDVQPGSPEPGYSVQVLLRSLERPELRHRGTNLDLAAADCGSTFLFDLEDAPTARFRSPFDNVRFFVKKSALSDLADRGSFPRVRALRTPEWGAIDPVLDRLGQSLLPAFARPKEANVLFLDSVAAAFVAHLAANYGERPLHPRMARGGLSARQLRRAQEMIESNLDGSLPLEMLASECGLSVGHFSRAFRSATGLPPHRWLLLQRIARAKRMMESDELTLSEIAVRCGFADQSHFTKVFGSLAGQTPGAWRRDNGAV